MSVPADDEVMSLTGLGGNGGAAFTTTHWSVVLEAQGQSPAAQEALEKLCRTYWRPIYSFVRRQGIQPEEAEDITQVFSRCYWSAEILVLSVRKRGDFVLIYFHR